MRCAKRKYRDRIAALMALAVIDNRGADGHCEKRAYFHQSCHAWHLTSKVRTPPNG